MNKINNLVNKILYELEIYKPPIDVYDIANRLNIKISHMEFGKKYKNDVSGFLEFSNNIPTIIINADISINQKMFTIAHELGHYFLHNDWSKSNDYNVSKIFDFNNNSQYDFDADYFARSLLMPKTLINKYSKIANNDELSTIFIVSKSLLKKRLKELKPWCKF